jgi:hypothetical protein
VEYEKAQMEKKLGKWHLVTKGDLSLYAITGYFHQISSEQAI